MAPPGGLNPLRLPSAMVRALSRLRRGHLAVLLTLVAVVCLGSALFSSPGTQLLMPGPLASGHGAIEKCDACHTKSGSGKLSWIHGLVAADPLADSKACLACHKMPDTAFNAHGASPEVLKLSTKRLAKIAVGSSVPQSARAQSIAFPMDAVMAGDIYCATCHQEHQGANFSLNKISNAQCTSCHALKFDGFDGHHPKFENYPFERRTRITYDHAGHFGKHFPEVAKKDPTRRIPATCSACHGNGVDRRVMAVAPFDQTCTSCHLDQIIGKERVSGPKGIAFLTLPALDLEALNKKNSLIGEWPDASEAALTPFMKMIIGRSEEGRALLKAVDGVDLQDLAGASDDQLKAVTKLAWEIKGLFHALIKGRASDVLGALDTGGGTKLSAALVADLTASIPLDAVIGAQQAWLPNLAAEMANGPGAPPEEPAESNADQAVPAAPPEEPEAETAEEPDAVEAEPAGAKETVCDDELPRAREVAQAEDSASEPGVAAATPGDGEEAPAAEEQGVEVIPGRLPLPSGTPRAIKALAGAEKATQPKEADTAEVSPDGGGKSPCVEKRPEAETAAQADESNGEAGATEAKADAAGGEEPSAAETPSGNETGQFDDLLFPTGEELATAKKSDAASQAEESGGEAGPAEAKADAGGSEAPSAVETPSKNGTDQFDDLLFPTDDDLAAAKKGNQEAGSADEPAEAAAAEVAETAQSTAPPDSGAASAIPQPLGAPAASIESDVDPENWAEYGGWYRQDYAIFYRPVGHKDKFTYSWLSLTGPQAQAGDASPAAAVFDYLTSKDAQGSCTKCHSVDEIRGKGRVVNFSPASVKNKQGRFTNFIHEPHFGVMGNRGCLTCHSLANESPYLKSYEQPNPKKFASSFNPVKKELCQTCHASGKARQDCLLCHTYHVNGATTPIMNTKIPVQ